MTRVEIAGIAKSYVPNVPVLKPIELVVEPGELFFLLGPSGCGKSTLLRILAGLVEPDAGSIRFNDVEITRLPSEKRRTAMVFQNYALWPHLSVFENIAFGLRTAGASKAEIKREVALALALVRMEEFAERRIPSLSGGQQQRVALARALAVHPALLLLDEPLSNLDARLRDTMRREIRRICKERNLTAIYVTHDRQEALGMADRLAVMESGILRQLGTPEEVYNRPANRFVATFLGDANFFEPGVFGDRSVMIRPERIRFAEGPGENVLEAELVNRNFAGESCEWECRAGEISFTVVESAPQPRKTGDRCFFYFPPDQRIGIEG